VVLALLFALVSTYKKIVETAAPEGDTQVQEQMPSQEPEQVNPDSTGASFAAGGIEIYDAAAIAAKILGHNDVYITEYSQLDGADVYLVTFLSGDLVYIGLDGQVISASKQGAIKPNHPTSHR
jgi:hypothetical protein